MTTVNLDEQLKDTSNPEFDIPMVRNTPEGWSSYFTMEGETWYERAMNYQKWCGHPPIPLAYMYDENWNIVKAEDYKPKEEDNGSSTEQQSA